MVPTSIIRVWFIGLFSWVLLGVGIYLSHKWYQRAWSYDFNLHRSYFDPHIGNNHETLLLAVAVGLLFFVLTGGLIVRGILSLLTKTKGSAVSDAPPKGQRCPGWVGQMVLSYGSNVMAGRMPPLGFIGTTLLGIAGSVIGGLIARLFSRPEEGSKFHPAGFLMSLVGAIVVVFLARLMRLACP